MNSLEELYRILQTSQEGIDYSAVTNSILEIYSNPNSIFLIFDLLSNNDSNIRHQAAIGLEKVFKIHWGSICQLPQSEQIKSKILEILKTEQNQLIRKNIVHAMSRIIYVSVNDETREIPWFELFNFLEEMFKSNNNNQYQTALDVLFVMVPSNTILPLEQLNQMLPLIIQHIIASLSSTDPDYILSGANLFYQILPRLPGVIPSPAPSPFPDIFQQIMTIFHNSLINMSNLTDKFSEVVSRMIEGNRLPNFVPNDQLLSALLQISIDPRIDPSYHYFIFDPISLFISKETKPLLKHFLPDLLKALYHSISLNFVDECYQVTSTAGTLCNVIDDLCELLNGDHLYSLISPILSTNSPNESFATILIIDRFIEYAPDSISSNSGEITMLLLKNSDPSCHHSIREASIFALGNLINIVQFGMTDFFELITNACIAALNSGDQELAFFGVQTLTISITSIDFASKYSKPLFEQLCMFLQLHINNRLLLPDIIAAISSLIDSSGEDVISYIPNIINIIVQAAQVDENIDPILKGKALEALSKIISYAPNETTNIIIPTLQLLMSSMNSQDPSIISSLLIGFASIISNCHLDIVQSILPQIVQFAMNQIQDNQDVVVSYGYDDNEIDETQKIELERKQDCVINAISLINEIVKVKPEILVTNAQEILERIKKLLEDTNSDLIVKIGVKTFTRIILKYSFDPNENLQQISHLFDEMMFNFVKPVFDCSSKLIENNAQLNQDAITFISHHCIAALNRKLPCFECDMTEDEEEENESINYQTTFMNSIFRCLNAIVKKIPQMFDISSFIKAVQNAIKANRITEVLQSVEVIGNLFKSYSASITGLYLKFMLKLVLDSLQFCNCNNRPTPLIAFKEIIEINPQVIAQIINNIISKIDEILQTENRGQPYYYQTLAAAVAFLFTLVKIQGKEFVRFQFLGKMLSILPSKYESECIYSSIICLFEQMPDVFAEGIPLLIVGLARTLALSDDKLEKYKLSQQTYNGIVFLFKKLINMIPESQSIIESAFTDASEVARLQKRINQ